jgi:NitT/TauT family transport system ATP-binding protein
MNYTTLGSVSINKVSIHLGEGKTAFQAVQHFNTFIAPGEFVCLLGTSGCGKSTLLSALAGHVPLSSGNIFVDNKLIEAPDPERSIVFQQHTLFPWKNVLQNVAFGLKMRDIPRDKRHAQARELLKIVGLEDFADYYPAQLSGGMQQRVEIARVLINSPKVLLMDEPFTALDAQTRIKMQQLLMDIWERIHTTLVFVTHDIDEALFLADRILIMSPSPGRIVEEIRLDFLRPRHTDIITSGHFMQLKRRCLALLHPANTTYPQERLVPAQYS